MPNDRRERVERHADGADDDTREPNGTDGGQCLRQELAEQHDDRRGDRRRHHRAHAGAIERREERARHDRRKDVDDVVPDQDAREEEARVPDELENVLGPRVPFVGEAAQPEAAGADERGLGSREEPAREDAGEKDRDLVRHAAPYCAPCRPRGLAYPEIGSLWTSSSFASLSL
jgi:hypothetical protein